MQADLAAKYCGVSKSKFLTNAGRKYPKGVRDGGNVLWYREDLDLALDRLKGEGAPSSWIERLEDVCEAETRKPG